MVPANISLQDSKGFLFLLFVGCIVKLEKGFSDDDHFCSAAAGYPLEQIELLSGLLVLCYSWIPCCVNGVYETQEELVF